MPEVTVRQFADVVGISVERLLEQLEEAGLEEKSAEDAISDEEKSDLLLHLRRKHGKDDATEPKKITLKRKTITISSSTDCSARFSIVTIPRDASS